MLRCSIKYANCVIVTDYCYLSKIEPEFVEIIKVLETICKKSEF